MIYNDSLAKSYGIAPVTFVGVAPKLYVPLVSTNDYNAGFFKRTFAKKINEYKTVEIKYSDSTSINSSLYKLVTINWKVSGPKNNVMKNGVLDKSGVTEQNRYEIERANTEDGVDLSATLPNLLEFWRGH